MKADVIIFVGVVVLAASCVIGLVLHHRFLTCLRDKQTSTWNELGRPTLFANNSVKNFLAIRRFLRTLGSSTISDRELIGRGRALLLFGDFYFALFGIVVLSIVYVLATHR